MYWILQFAFSVMQAQRSSDDFMFWMEEWNQQIPCTHVTFHTPYFSQLTKIPNITFTFPLLIHFRPTFWSVFHIYWSTVHISSDTECTWLLEQDMGHVTFTTQHTCTWPPWTLTHISVNCNVGQGRSWDTLLFLSVLVFTRCNSIFVYSPPALQVIFWTVYNG